jgi:hypothetical protein
LSSKRVSNNSGNSCLLAWLRTLSAKRFEEGLGQALEEVNTKLLDCIFSSLVKMV